MGLFVTLALFWFIINIAMKYPKMTNEEKNVIFNKGTEKPFSGKYVNFFDPGTYVCRRCKTPLYRSNRKFDGHCGWPSFEKEISRKVRKIPDNDGKRLEIQCALCGAHLGHIFEGEKLTPVDIRHCVNSISLQFVSKKEACDLETAVFGGGCFWSMEAMFEKIRGVYSVLPGYSGGKLPNPTYEEVSAGSTEYAEVIKIEFDPEVISYSTLIDVFFEIHDPTTLNRQGNDVGTQYRSIVLYSSEEQKIQTVENMRRITKLGRYNGRPIFTEIRSLDRFYPAEDYHHDYYKTNIIQPYCKLIISPKLNEFQIKFRKLLIE